MHFLHLKYVNNIGGETLYSLSEVYQIMIVSCIFHHREYTEEFPMQTATRGAIETVFPPLPYCMIPLCLFE